MKHLALLALMPSLVLAHAHAPIEIGGETDLLEAVTTTQVDIVTVKVGNRYPNEVEYSIRVDGEEVGRKLLAANQDLTEVKVPVKLKERGKPQTILVCSVANTGSVNTQICTKVKKVWL